jgi:ADP-ribosylglycohydrolase
MPTLDQFKGCLIGQAVGDAVGAPVEKSPTEKTREYIERCVETKDFSTAPPSTFEGLSFGTYTDDTQLARELVESLVENEGRFSAPKYAQRIAAMFENDHMVGAGRGTRNAAQNLISGVPWDEAGAETGGNGSAMRVGPLALVADNPTYAFDLARLQSRITHQSTEAQLSAGIVALAVWYAANMETVDHTMAEAIAEHVGTYDTEFAEQVRRVGGYTNGVLRWVPHTQCLDYIVTEVQGKTSWEGINPYCRSSVLWALYAFLRSPKDYWATIQLAMWPGGDVDTMAAMAGAMSGAHNGLDQIPEEVAFELRGDQGKGFLYLSTLMESLYYAVHKDED